MSCTLPSVSRWVMVPDHRKVTVARPMCGCGRTSMPRPGSKIAGPMWSTNTNGPTLRACRDGTARRTWKPPRSCTRGAINVVIGSLHDRAMAWQATACHAHAVPNQSWLRRNVLALVAARGQLTGEPRRLGQAIAGDVTHHKVGSRRHCHAVSGRNDKRVALHLAAQQPSDLLATVAQRGVRTTGLVGNDAVTEQDTLRDADGGDFRGKPEMRRDAEPAR